MTATYPLLFMGSQAPPFRLVHESGHVATWCDGESHHRTHQSPLNTYGNGLPRDRDRPLYPCDCARYAPVTTPILPLAQIPEGAILDAPPLDYPKGVRGVFLGRLIGQCNDWDIVAIPAQSDELPADPLVRVVG